MTRVGFIDDTDYDYDYNVCGVEVYDKEEIVLDNIFSEPWNDSDVVLAIEDKEFHVHRSILSLQSPAFKAMFNGNFKDATQDKIELKDDNYEAMLQFLKLLYPPNMLNDAEVVEVHIDDKNIFKIIEVADKYGARNVIKQCMKETLKPENAMRLLPYAVKHKLPREAIFDVINRKVSTEKLIKLEPELDNDRVYVETLMKKCRFLENLAMRVVRNYANVKLSGREKGILSRYITDGNLNLSTLWKDIITSLES